MVIALGPQATATRASLQIKIGWNNARRNNWIATPRETVSLGEARRRNQTAARRCLRSVIIVYAASFLTHAPAAWPARSSRIVISASCGLARRASYKSICGAGASACIE
jgi:hypothetical protein